MNCLIMVEQFDIKLPESYYDCNEENDEKNSFECKKLTDLIGKKSGLLHAAPSTL